jgi:hypothetical protein
VLPVCSSEVSFEVCPIFLNVWLFIPPATGTHEVPSGKYFGITHIYLLWVPNDDAICFRIVSTILDLFEKGLTRLLWVPCVAHLFEIVFQINSCDVSINHEKVVQHLPSCNICKTHHFFIENVQLHRLKNSDDFF